MKSISRILILWFLSFPKLGRWEDFNLLGHYKLDARSSREQTVLHLHLIILADWNIWHESIFSSVIPYFLFLFFDSWFH